MKTATRWFLLLVVSACGSAFGADIELMGYPTSEVTYKFVVYAGETDRWDSAKQDAPRLSPGKACQAARAFIRGVPLQDNMKEWRMSTITLERMSAAPEEWLYLIHFDAQPKADVWNGPVPWIVIPVRFDGTIPKPTITKSK
jgi:hypothetical protein